MDAIEKNQTLRSWLVAAVVAHLATTVWHGVVHVRIPVNLTYGQATFISIVIILLPIAGAGLLWTRWKNQATLLIAVSMCASLVFGIVNHFILDSPDYILSVPHHEWQHSFVLSAAVIIVPDAVGTIVGVLAAVEWRRRSRTNL